MNPVSLPGLSTSTSPSSEFPIPASPRPSSICHTHIHTYTYTPPHPITRIPHIDIHLATPRHILRTELASVPATASTPVVRLIYLAVTFCHDSPCPGCVSGNGLLLDHYRNSFKSFYLMSEGLSCMSCSLPFAVFKRSINYFIYDIYFFFGQLIPWRIAADIF